MSGRSFFVPAFARSCAWRVLMSGGAKRPRKRRGYFGTGSAAENLEADQEAVPEWRVIVWNLHKCLEDDIACDACFVLSCMDWERQWQWQRTRLFLT